MKSNLFKVGRVAVYALVIVSIFYGMRTASAQRRDGGFARPNLAGGPIPQGAISPTPTPTPSATPTASPTATATPTATPLQEINGTGTFRGPGGTGVQFFMVDIEDEQITQNFLEGFFHYRDRGSHVSFGTGKITSVTINGDQASFSGTATIGKSKQPVNFIVSVTGNKVAPNEDSFSISLSNGYSAGGTLTKGSISIGQGDD
jgi:hypothetical protein